MQQKTLYELFLNKDSWSDQKEIVGRNNELNRLVRIIRNSEGSTVLIAGDRGSGKTTTIRQATKKARQQRFEERGKRFRGLGYLVSWTRLSQVYIDVPLLTSETTENEIRSAVLRLIVQTLVSEWNAKGLWDRMRMPITYSSAVSDLEYTLKYKRIVKKNGGSASYKKSGIKVGGKREVEYELDLTYADIELKLRDLFIRYSKFLDFIIVFDELDKYESQSDEALKPHMYIKELKNLFTLSKAKFIFTSTENYYHEIDEKAKSNALSLEEYKFSLFTYKVLINHLNPADFTSYFSKLFVNLGTKSIRLDEYTKLQFYIMWASNLYPHSAKKILFELSRVKDDSTSYIDLESIDRDMAEYGTNIVGLQHLLNTIYGRFSNDNNEYFNRLLYLSLKKVVQLFYSGVEVKVNKSNFFSLIYADLEFEEPAAREAYFQGEYTPYREPDLEASSGTWERRIGELGSILKDDINSAILELVWQMNGLGQVDLVQDQASISMMTLYYSEEEFTLQDAIDGVEYIHDNQRRLVNQRNTRSRLLKKIITNTGIDMELPALLSEEREGRTASGVPFGIGWMLGQSVEQDIVKLNEKIKESSDMVNAKVQETINKEFGSKRVSPRASNNYRNDTFLIGSKEFPVLVNPDLELLASTINDNQYEKTVIINAKEKIRNNVRAKYFTMKTKEFADFPRILEESIKYIHDLETK